MSDVLSVLGALRRPRLLIRAARFGLCDYNRDRDLRRLTQADTLPTPARAIPALIETEAELEEIRRAGDASYSVARHVEVLIAIMAEARLLPRQGLGA